MPATFFRLGRKPVASSSASLEPRQGLQGHDPTAAQNSPAYTSPIDRRIHPDLNSLISEDVKSTRQSLDAPSTTIGFTPLPLSTRKRPINHHVHSLDNSNSTTGNVAQPVKYPSSSITSQVTSTNDIPSVDKYPQVPIQVEKGSSSHISLPEVTSGKKISPRTRSISGEEWPTFGRVKNPLGDLGEFGALSNAPSTTPVTPNSEASEGITQTQTDGSTSTPGSHLGSSYDHYNSPSYSFGVSTPPSTGFTFGSRYRFHDTDTPPPMPPLNHPAFFDGTILKTIDISRAFSTSLKSKSKSIRYPKGPRHASSLPSLSRRGANTSSSSRGSRKTRKRARTQSRTTAMEVFSDHSILQTSTPRNRNHSQLSRSKSRESNSSRRFSAEFSARQASTIGHGSGFAGNWEAEVSREMVRISLGTKQERSGYEMVAGYPKLEQARGNSLSTTSTLGSPFLLQDAHAHNIPGAIPDDRARTKSNLVGTGGSRRKGRAPPMSKDVGSGTSGVGKETLVGSRSNKERSSPPARTRTPSPRLNTIPYPDLGIPSSSLLVPPSLSFTAPTPEASPLTPVQREQHQKSYTGAPVSVLRTPPTARTISSSSQKGKRKADEAGVEGGGTPPKDQKEHRATFAIDPRPHRVSANSGSTRAPSSYHRKRARLSMTPESRPGSRASVDHQNAASTGSWSSKGSAHLASHHRQPPPAHQPRNAPSRQSLSQTSIPISALVSPHAPSVSRSTTFHMRDPRKPGPVQTTPWSLSFPSGEKAWSGWLEQGGSPLHAWLFFIGFIIFPIWWVAAFLGIPRTRRLGGNDVEKSVVLDDPQVEHDAKSWRNRCRIMAVVSLFTYVPFIILVAIFAR